MAPQTSRPHRPRSTDVSATARADREPGTLALSAQLVNGWGGGPGVWVQRWPVRSVESLLDDFERLARNARPAGAIARGLGRSYGDAAQCSGGLVLDATGLRGIELDVASGTATAGAGVTLGELLAAAIPSGLIVPVVPGTQHVTIGGAIASDIHGKNHGERGTFGAHVLALTLLTGTGEVIDLTPGSDLFDATVGGMGLTGVIVSARVRMRRVASAILSVDTDRVATLDAALAALSEPGGEHRVAWLDLLAGPEPRGVVTRARHANGGEPASLAPRTVSGTARATVPRRWPAVALRTSTVRAFNQLRWRRAPLSERGAPEPFATHMFPLDVLDAWPRLYGPEGFLQYQLVVPRGAEEVLRAVPAELRRARVPCFLAVLKDFGPAGTGLLSFPLEGWTLALDVPRRAPGVHEVLERCDELVLAAGGRVYLSKDARTRAEVVQAMYPRLREFRSIRDRSDPDGLWRSDLALRTGLVSP